MRAYASLYLGEEVQAEGLVRNIGHFSRFLETISFAHGGVLNSSNIARECAVGRKTAEGYVEILEDLLLAFRLPVFRRRAGRQVTATPKLYLFDSGVFRSLRPTGPLDRPGGDRRQCLGGVGGATPASVGRADPGRAQPVLLANTFWDRGRFHHLRRAGSVGL